MRVASHAIGVGAALFFAASVHAHNEVGGDCLVEVDCISGCCGTLLDPPVCLEKALLQPGDDCQAQDGCDCEIGLCINDVCDSGSPTPTVTDEGCVEGTDCGSGCCATELDDPICVEKSTMGLEEPCSTLDGCDCEVGLCENGVCSEDTDHGPAPTACPPGTDMCGDPHMQGLRGQAIDWSGVDGGWYCLVTDRDTNIHINVRLTAPLPEEFPDRQLVTGVSILSEGHYFVIEVTNPYDVATEGCPSGISPCLADGGLSAVVDGEEVDGLLRFSKNQFVAEGIALSASNLPVECRQFGGDKIWARMYDELLQGRRQLSAEETFEKWILRFATMAAPDWCARYIAEHGLADVQSNHAVFKVVTSSVEVRLYVGTNYQINGESDWDGRVLPDLEFWQMNVGLQGLSLESESLSGILGETARPVVDKDGHAVMQGLEAIRGTVEDYRVSGSLGTEFSLPNNE